ncbi:MAG: GGDEF domain-containing protein [Gammaproteobacteria bacterium]|nr:MAG: GGDEF domain-containing protein [Gammaproteobacteria bacterium]
MQAAPKKNDTNFDPLKIIDGDAPAEQHEDFVFDQRLKMNSHLQTTLELNSLIDIFYQEIKQTIAIDGITYEHAGRAISITKGFSKKHSCHYQLKIDDSDCGEICFYRKKRFSEADTYDIELLIGSLLYPLKNALMYQQALKSALTDHLTGAGNRAALEQTLEREWELSRRNKQPISMLMLDLDYFKKINDTFGHNAGDATLKGVVQQIQTLARTTDMIFRYGGEEFVLILNNTGTDGAAIIAERIREVVEETLFDADRQQIHVTVSIGVATQCHTGSRDSLLQQADRNLYAAKQAGRNRIYFEEIDLCQKTA